MPQKPVWWEIHGVKELGFLHGPDVVVDRVQSHCGLQLTRHTVSDRFRRLGWPLKFDKRGDNKLHWSDIKDPTVPKLSDQDVIRFFDDGVVVDCGARATYEPGNPLPKGIETSPLPRIQHFSQTTAVEPDDGWGSDPVTPVSIIEEERGRSRQAREREELKVLRADAVVRADLMDEIRSELRAFPKLHIVPPLAEQAASKYAGTLLLHLSDIHLGGLFQSHNNGSYSIDIAAERIKRLSDKVIAIAEATRLHRKVDQLVIAWGGDIIDGRDIHPGHDWQSAPAAVQLNRGTQIARDLLMVPLAKVFPSIWNLCVPGNHGRIGKKGQLHRVQDSLDVVYYNWLEDRCAGMAHVKWQQAQDYYAHFTLHGHRFVLAHGDAFKAWAGIPFYGATRYLQRLSSMLHAPIDALLVGHHHNAASWLHGHSNIVMNGAMVAGGEFATWLGYGGPAVQNLMLVEPRYAVATRYDLILTTREEVLTQEPLNMDALFDSATKAA